jgi:hypothetical protein
MKEKSNPFSSFEARGSSFRLSFWTILIVLIIFVLGFILLPLPSRILTIGQISTMQPSYPLELKTEGKIIFLDSSSMLEKGKTLLVIEDDVKIESLKVALSFLDSIGQEGYVDLNLVSNLGELQYAWNAVVASYQNIKLDPIKLRFVQNASQSRTKLLNLNSEREKLIELQRLNQNELDLVSSNFQSNKQLFEMGELSKQELDRWGKEVLNVRQKMAELLVQQVKLDSEHEELKQILDSEKQILHLDKGLAAIEFENQVNDLRNSLILQIANMNIIAPMVGSVQWGSDVVLGSFHKTGKIVGVLYPHPLNPTIRFKIPAKDIHKVKRGKTVKIYLDDFPKQKFGYLSTELGELKSQNENGFYVFNLPLDSFQSSKKKDLDIKPGMQATIKVQTASISLMQRILAKMNP